MKPTYEQLEATLIQTQELLKRALEKLIFLEKEVESLKNQLNKNSKNSSKPPSTDQKPNTPEGPKKERKSRQGKHRPLFSKDRIDKTIECSHAACPCCASSSMTIGSVFHVLHQVELPEVRALVTEYILRKSTCKDCGVTSYADLPNGVPDSVFGPNLMGLVASLTGAFHLSKREALQLIKDLYDIDIGVGSISNIEEKVTAALDPIYKRIHDYVLEGRFSKHFDETTWRDEGKRHYVWLASCKEAAVYVLDRYRNKEAFLKLIQGKDLSDTSFVSDRYSVYMKQSQYHQFCLAHLIREFRGFAEKKNEDGQIGAEIEKLLSLTCHEHKKYREGKQSLSERNRKIKEIQKKVEHWFYEGLANGSNLLSGLCNRLLDDFDRLWMFARIEGMEPTNNLAERDLRKLVIWRKKSYGTKSDRGKRFVERITTVTQTLRKQGGNAVKYIQAATRAFFQKTSPPYINPAFGI